MSRFFTQYFLCVYVTFYRNIVFILYSNFIPIYGTQIPRSYRLKKKYYWKHKEKLKLSNWNNEKYISLIVNVVVYYRVEREK